MKRFLPWLLYSLCLIGCAQSQTDSTSFTAERSAQSVATTGTRYLDPIFTADQVLTKEEVYSSDPRLLLTSYFVPPAIDKEKKKAVIIFLHGGGATKDDPTCVKWCTYWATHGYTALSINYYEGRGAFTGELQKQAVFAEWSCLQWVRENQGAGHVDGTKIFAMGQSAGAVTAFQAMLASYNLTDAYLREWATNKNNLGLPVTVLATATISGAANGVFEKWISTLSTPSAFYSGLYDNTVPYKKQVEQYGKMVSSRVPHMNKPVADSILWAQRTFDTGHTVGNFDSVSHTITLQFYSLLK